jgi:hypothetical protein
LVEGGLLMLVLSLWLTEEHLIGQIVGVRVRVRVCARLSDERFLVGRKWTEILGQ